MTPESVERIRLPDGRSFTLRCAVVEGQPWVMRATSGKGSAMIERAREIVTDDPAASRARLLATLALIPPEEPSEAETVPPVLTFGEAIAFAGDCLARAEAMESDARELRDEARRVVQRAMS